MQWYICSFFSNLWCVFLVFGWPTTTTHQATFLALVRLLWDFTFYIFEKSLESKPIMFTYDDEHQQSPKDASSKNNKDTNILILLDNQGWNKMVSILGMFKIIRSFSIFIYWLVL